MNTGSGNDCSGDAGTLESKATTDQFLPNLFILGAAKCGTTTLHNHLSKIPEICMSKPKEPFFFEAYFDKGLEFYRRNYFRHWNGEPIVGESRHRNLIQPYVPERLHKTNPDAKLLVMVRDPAERAYSHWYHNYSRLSEPLRFRDAIREDHARIDRGLFCTTEEEIRQHVRRLARQGPGRVVGLGLYRTYVDSGYYFDQIQRYLRYFPVTSMKVVLLEDLATNPVEVVNGIAKFLGVSKVSERARFLAEHRNKSKKFPEELQPLALRLQNRLGAFMARLGFQTSQIDSADHFRDKATMRWLRRHYVPHNEKLSDFLGRDLSSWDRDRA